MSLFKKCVAEFIGTAVLVCFACGVAAMTGASMVATSLAFGLVIVAMAYSIGNVSGCHINPAVSFAMALSGKLSWKDFLFYVIAQVLGAVVGAAMLGLFMGGKFSSLGGNEVQPLLSLSFDEFPAMLVALLAEVVLTFVFIIAILGVTSKESNGAVTGIVIGLALVLVHLLGLSLTGTSVNPARSFGPALLQAFAGKTASLQQIWIWIIGPMAGAGLAAFTYKKLAK